MELSIERIPLDSATDDELFQLIEEERPFIVTGVPRSEDVLTPEYIKRYFMIRENLSDGHYQSPQLDSRFRVETPSLVNHTFNAANTYVRSTPLRVWMQPNGHRTVCHYDGNGVSGLSLQIRGQKTWFIVSPSTPLPFVPFGRASPVPFDHQPDPIKHDVYTFNHFPGEMLHLPRYWSHVVKCTGDDLSINLNWVWAPLAVNTDVEVGRRECEILRLRHQFPALNAHMQRWSFARPLANYGGDSITQMFADAVTDEDAYRRFFDEVPELPRPENPTVSDVNEAIKHIPIDHEQHRFVKEMFKELYQNNCNV